MSSLASSLIKSMNEIAAISAALVRHHNSMATNPIYRANYEASIANKEQK